MRRRDFIAGLGGAAGWPLLVMAQTADEADQWPRHRVITGFLDSRFSVWSVDSPSQTVAGDLVRPI